MTFRMWSVLFGHYLLRKWTTESQLEFAIFSIFFKRKVLGQTEQKINLLIDTIGDAVSIVLLLATAVHFSEDEVAAFNDKGLLFRFDFRCQRSPCFFVLLETGDPRSGYVRRFRCK